MSNPTGDALTAATPAPTQTAATPAAVLPAPQAADGGAAPSTGGNPNPAPDAANTAQNTDAGAADTQVGATLLGGEREKAAGDEAKTSAEDTPAPIEYKDFVLPEGVQPDKDVMDGYKSHAAKHALTQEQAQANVDFYHQVVIPRIQAAAAAPIEAYKAITNQWKQDFYADPEIGGTRAEQTLQTIEASVKQFGGTPQQQSNILKALEISGMGVHSDILRWAYNMSLGRVEGQPVGAGSPSNKAAQSAAQILYGGGQK